MVTATALSLLGCASTPKMSYTGEPLPDNQIARISVEVKERSWEDALLAKRPNQIFITHVDQQPLGSFWSVDGSAHKVVDLLPGERSIAVASISSDGRGGALIAALDVAAQLSDEHQASGYGKVLKLNAQAGHKYIVKYIEKRLPLICWVEDEATGEVISGDKPSEFKNVK
jgi:hypothetical protein